MDQSTLRERITSALKEIRTIPEFAGMETPQPTDEQIAAIMPAMIARIEFIDKKIEPDYSIRNDSNLFNFKGKFASLTSRFKDEGLTANDYMQAALQSPQLFDQSPDTIESNIRTARLAGHESIPSATSPPHSAMPTSPSPSRPCRGWTSTAIFPMMKNAIIPNGYFCAPLSKPA